jgi:hypothetical protein
MDAWGLAPAAIAARAQRLVDEPDAYFADCRAVRAVRARRATTAGPGQNRAAGRRAWWRRLTGREL